ncbi:hypothetical protein HWV62_40469 [Athelia sp. TMB]|nr:hypothetical protein HWV62_40469 [Athelia sp. TMB]
MIRNGSGGESIYGGPFADEDLSRNLDSAGLLCMANKGPDTNGSQFFITLKECPHLNGKHVVFGKVVRGLDDVVQKLAIVPVDAKDRPQVPVEIHNCGELELRRNPEQSKKGEIHLLSGLVYLSSLHVGTVTEDVRSGSDDEREAARRRKHRSDSPDDDSSRRRRKKSKRKKSVSATPADVIRIDRGGPAPETEEEYDERLEREENERREQERQKQLERIKQQYADSAQTTEGVRFKGRGRMKFVDPEVSEQRQR